MSSSNGSNSFGADACFFPAAPDLRLLVTDGSSGGSSEALASSSDGGATSFVDLRQKCHRGGYLVVTHAVGSLPVNLGQPIAFFTSFLRRFQEDVWG